MFLYVYILLYNYIIIVRMVLLVVSTSEGWYVFPHHELHVSTNYTDNHVKCKFMCSLDPYLNTEGMHGCL